MTMKMNKLFSILTLASAMMAFVPSAFAFTGGDIVDIRVMDDPNNGMVFNGVSRNGPGTAYYSALCTADRPLTAGDKIYIRVRMLVRNYEEVARFGREPKTWGFKEGLLGGSALYPPKLGLFMGENRQPVYAEFSDIGPSWQRSGELKTDDLGNATDAEGQSNEKKWCYFTDFYFVYTVKAGDLALPLRLLNAAGTGPAFDEDTGLPYYLLNCSADGTGHWFIGDGAGASANFFYGYSGLPNYTHWPTGDETTKGPATNYDLHNEGAYIKTVEFGDADPDAGGSWREVYAGLEPNLKPTLRIMGGTSAEATTVYLCCTNDTVELLASGNNTLITTTDGLTVLKVPVPAGSKDNIPFSMKGAETAKEGDVAKIFMSPVPSIFSKTLTGELEKNTVFREVRVGKAPQPTVQMRFENNTTMHDAVTADADYQTAKAQLILKAVPAASGPVTVTLSATVGGSRSLSALYNENLIRIPDGNIFDIDGKIEEVTIPAGETVTLSLYVLGASEETEQGLNFKIAKKSGPDDVLVETYGHSITLERAGEEGLAITKANPAANTSVGVTMGETKTFKVQFSDTWKNITTSQTGYKGYTFYLDDIDSGDTVATASDVKLQSGWFSPKLKVDLAPGTYNVVLWAMAPDGLTTTDQIPYTLAVGDSKHVTIEPTDGRYVVGEGDALTYKLGLNQQLTGTAAKYIFLAGLTEADAALISTSLTTTGAKIDEKYQFVTNPQEIRYLDGGASGTTVSLQGFVANSPTDLKDTDNTWSPGSIQITVTNKPPQVKSLMIAGQRVTMDKNGKTLDDPVSSGVPKTFKLLTVDEVAADLDTLDVMWVIDGMECVTHGHPTNLTSTVVTNFPNAKPNGAVVQVYLKDKDMLSWPADPNFECRVTVNKKPYVDIFTSAIGSTFVETDKSVSTITVALSEPATAPVTVRFKISQVKDGGFLSIRTDESTVKQAVDEAGKAIPGEYDIAFESGVQQVILIVDEMDGTNETLGGLDLTAEVTTEDLNPDGSGVKWKDYYNKGRLTPPLRVENVPPTVIRPTPAEMAYTNENASANVPFDIYYGCRDVASDLATGIVVTVTVDGTPVFTTNVTDATVRSQAVSFESEGPHTVEISYTDKDQMTSRATLQYYVKPSKRLELRAHGPAIALGTSGGYSMHYASAPGLGAGRVYAGTKGPQSVQNFVHMYSFNETETAISAYAAGYRADAALFDDGTLTPFGDHAITKDGNSASAADIAGKACYNYALDRKWCLCGSLGFDSFLYGWACNNTASTSGSSSSGSSGGASSSGTTTTVQSFLLNIGEYGETKIPLPATDDNSQGSVSKAYPIQYWEAVFSRELFKTDNCGDINQDGIPDLAVYRYGMGVVDTTTYKLITTASGGGDGNLPEGDLTDLREFNKDKDKDGVDDPDFLPASDNMAYASLIPGLKAVWETTGRPFSARLEIRGYHDGLNDAALTQLADGTPNPCALNGVRSDCIYAEAVETAPGETSWQWTANCTISELEFMAWSEYAAQNGWAVNEWTNEVGALRWSPERPTNPTKSDTDGDGFTDGYEYYFWYKAYVGYLDENGVHRRLTGRRYDERNPGEGRLITSEEIAALMDPLTASGDASSADMRDTDNDGLPDLLEFEIGTNPFDFDTDGDGLPDGWELTIAGLNPLLPATSDDALMDTERNYDGDAMAITSWKLEENVKPRDLDVDRIRLWTFATIDPNGDTDGVQWYATKTEPAVNVTTNAEAVWSFKSGDRYYVSFEQPFATADGRLANMLKKGVLNAKGAGAGAFVATKPDRVITPIEEPEPDGPTEATNYVAGALYPVRLEAGLPISDISGEKVDLAVTTIKTAIKEKDANACWIYGKDPKGSADALAGEVAETAADYGCLALGRQLGAAKDAVVCALPSHDRDVAFLHYLVYQEFGFDPRTAWKAKDPLANRWSKTIDGEAVEGITVLRQGGYTGAPARTRDYTTYDEFLVYSFFLNSGCDMEGVTYIKGSKALAVVKAWGAFTTNPQGPNEPDAIHLEAEGAADYYFGTKNGENGADTDGDGVPDGWELYVMAGPKYKGAYVFAPPYAGFVPALAHDAKKDYEMEKSFFSPFVDAAKTTDTSNQIYLGGQVNDDGLNEFKEFESTDAMNYYAGYSTTVVHADEWKWLNKFFPTDPWSKDTDGDGIDDKTEGSTFAYGTPADDGKLWSIPGGGLNPCSVDTDLDGLPDPWEKQYAGKKESLYAGDLASFAKDADGNPIGNALQGLTDGMDGTVKDAFTYPITYKGNESGGSNVTTYVVVEGVNQVVNRDYDRDGLENWQEYLTGTMRCWRYDDPLSPWTSIPDDWYWSENPVTGEKSWNPQYEKFGLEEGDEDGFWYMTLVDTWSEYYNPHLITGQNNGSQYFSRVTNAWDCAYSDAVLGKGPAYYHFYNRLNGEKFSDSWIKNGPLSELLGDLEKLAAGPTKYVGCSPIDHDSDHDGMDDYYELFHGMNPLLGEEGQVLDYGGPCDLVYDAWYVDGVGAPSALAKDKQRNYWHRHPWKTPRAGEKAASADLDFTVFPWLNGRQMSDPDGDDILNEEEALRGRDSVKSWHHTDPTPLWMTDSSYPNSLVRQFFRMPEGRAEVELPESGTFEHTDEEGNTTVYHFRDFDGFADAELEGRSYQGSPYSFVPFSIDAWSVCGADKMNWIFSFEENEGFDSDHDAISDHEELESKFRSGTDPQDADSPRRRQAMYFSGPDHPSALQTMPFVAEEYPLGATTYPTDLSFLRYTVECWVMPESLADATIIERAVYVGESNPGDQEFLRCNFRLAIKDGKWYTKFDPNGTLRGNPVEVFGSGAAKGAWTHLAATYDGEYLRLYVNGAAEVPKKSGLQPAYGSDAVAHQKNNSYWFDHEYDYKAILVGASFRTNAQGVNDGSALDVTEGRGWDRYCDFFKGYVDEIRVWDGARKPEEIKAAKDVRFDAAHAKENRSTFYDSWAQGKYRYADDGSGNDYDVPAELRFHWTFDSVPAAATAREVATSPHGFYNGKAPLSRPDDYGIAWWQTVLAGYVGTVYCDPAWVQWIPNTVTHLPRFDGTTLDSVYWSADFMGETAGEWSFARTAEPVSRWTQMVRNGVSANTQYKSTNSRHQMVNQLGETGVRFYALYDFTGRNLNQTGDDLLPLGGAYVKYLPTEPGVWDGQGASTTWEITGSDGDNDGLPDWWEIYVEQNERKRLGRDVTIGWDTIIDYHGIAMTAGEAYLRDLAKGVYVDANGKIHNDLPTEFAQTADEDFNGVPDWWTQMYGIEGEDGLADHDNDGLPNYVEYLLSEVFDFKLQFSPVKWDSITQGVPDYFHKVGELYVGEIFTDHDLVDDTWEDLYGEGFASRLGWDALADADQDGWSNRSEVRYSKMVLPIIADQQAHYETSGVEDESDGRIADYPIPTVSLTLSYIGARKDDVSKSPIVVKATRDGSLTKEFDAVFTVAGISEEKVDSQSGSTTKSGGSGKDDTNDNVGSLKRYLGKWSDRHAIGTLTPGNIKRESVLFEFAYTPSSAVYEWVVRNDLGEIVAISRGTIDEYRDVLRKYGSRVELTVKDSNYSVFQKVQLRPAVDSTKAIWFLPETGTDFGTLDLKTGAFDVNLGVFKGQYVQNPSNATDVTSLEDMTYRISYWSNMAAELPRQLYLGEAQTGYLREGKNSFVAWADLDGDGEWTVGEPYGMVRDVDVSWRGTVAEIELTDESPITPRIDLVSDAADGRGITHTELTEWIAAHPGLSKPTIIEWLASNPVQQGAVEGASFKGQRIRVVRWLLNDVPVYLSGAPARVVLDKKIETDVRTCLTEADFLIGNDTFDIDWNDFYGEVVSDGVVRERIGNVTNASYLVVVGDGDVSWDKAASTNRVYALNTVITRHFGATRVKPVPVAPGAVGEEIVRSANPTFKWTMNCPEEEGYTAFNVQVLDGSTVIYDSDKQLAPPRNIDGQYVWEAPLYVGDKTLKGKVFENKKAYSWKVSMYNAKYSNTAAYSDVGKFFMEVQTNGYEYGTANVAVRYFGPTNTWSKSKAVIRVRAYTSPDFTGLPVAAGYVAEQGSVTDTTVTNANCTVVGIPRGTYYLQAFIDSNENGVCDPWETQGYLCTRDGSTPNYLDPMAITFESKVGKGGLAIIYLEDADTDGDGLPDAWEYAEYGSLTAKGVELLSETKAGEFVVNTALSGTLALQENAQVPTAGLAGRLAGAGLMSNAGVLALAMGAETEGYDSFAAAIRGYVSPELVEDGVRITSLDLVDGKVSIKVEAETETAGSAWVKGSKELTVWCQVQWKQSLTSTDWMPLGKAVEITVGTEKAAEIPVEMPDADSGYFSVKVYKK